MANNYRTPEYNSWRAMKYRCDNPNDFRFEYYGGRGITYQGSWSLFKNFLADMGMKPTPAHTLDRVDPNKGYSKENCVWATRKEQCLTRRCAGKSKLGREFNEVAAWVRKAFPVKRGYRIESRPELLDTDGSVLDGEMRYTVGGSAPYRILIRRGMSKNVAIETLLHEVAHVLDVEKHPDSTDRKDCHSGTWGEEYARVYRAYHKWAEENK